jgi:hypothetical protein
VPEFFSKRTERVGIEGCDALHQWEELKGKLAAQGLMKLTPEKTALIFDYWNQLQNDSESGSVPGL